jgi:L-alanine-DL-glutamate epimerase-like enolase superfamily enzyme
MADFDLEFVEQPVMAQDVAGLAMVRRRSNTPIAADQASRTTHQVLQIIRADAADIVQSDPGSAGGMGAARKAAAIAETAGLPFVVHSNVEAGIGTAAAVHLGAACVNCSYANQTEYQFASLDVLKEPLRLEAGSIRVPDGPGLGVDVDEDVVQALAGEFAESHRSGEHDADVWYLPNY